MSQSNEISNRTIFAMCVASFVGMLSAVAVTLAIVMPMMKVEAAPAATTADVDPSYAAYVQGYMAAGAGQGNSEVCGEGAVGGYGAGVQTQASVGHASTKIHGGMGMGHSGGDWKPMDHKELKKSFKKWVTHKNSYTKNYHNTTHNVSNVNSNNTIDSNNKQDNSSHTSVKIDDSFNGKNSKFDADVSQTTLVNNHSFNKDSYNNTNTETTTTNNTTVVNDSFNKETEIDVENSFNKTKTNTEVTSNTEVNKETNINKEINVTKDSFNETNVDVDLEGGLVPVLREA